MNKETIRILVVEDDPDFAESLVIALGVHGCEVDLARTGEEAVKKFRSGSYELGFMDIKLPGKNGVESLAEIREFCPGAQVVMMTGYSESALLEQARQAGAVDILRKPFRLKEMFGIIDRFSKGAAGREKL